MALKSGKSGKKEDANVSLTLEAITTLLEQHHEALATEFKTTFNQLDSKLDQTGSQWRNMASVSRPLNSLQRTSVSELRTSRASALPYRT